MSSNVALLSGLRRLGAAALLLLAVPAAAAPRAAAQADSFPNAPDVILWPQHPCIEDDLVFYVRGYVSTPCDSFLGAFRSGDREITIRTLLRSNAQCGAAPSVFFAVPIAFGRLPAGPQTMVIRRRVLSWDGVTPPDSTTSSDEVSFSVANACPDPPPPFPAADLPFVDSVTTVPSPACPDRPVNVRFLGHFDNGCGRLVSAGLDQAIQLVLAPYPPNAQGPCPLVLGPWAANVSLGRMMAGSYTVLVRQKIKGTNAVWPPVFDLDYLGLFDFKVAQQSCDSLPTGLPYVDHLSVDSSDSLGICANHPYRVRIGGTLPNVCWSVRHVQLLPGTPPATLRVVLDDGGCKDMLCPNVPVPWDTTVSLAGLPAGSYLQHFQVGLVTCSDSVPPEKLYETAVPFTVVPAESCGLGPPPPVGCLLVSWAGGSSGCNAFLAPGGGGASLTLGVAGGVALSGLQGELRFVQPGLRIAALETVGPAIGMHLTWAPTSTGAKFVMFAEHGAPIPGTRVATPVLRVVVEPLVIAVSWPADGFDLQALSLLGSDADGNEVVECPTFAYAPPTAHICFDRPCDFDGNGVADVRDLVRMVHCVNGDGPCPPDSVSGFDCNGDSHFDLADVLCCAVHLLGAPNCPECPTDTIRDEPSVKATFGDPILTSAGVDVPLRLVGADRVGAARLTLRFPGDRFTFAGAETPGSAWLELHQAGDGQAAVGLIRIAPNLPLSGTVGGTLDLVLHLALRPGQAAGGDIALPAGELSGPDGVLLRVDLAASPRSLDGKPTVAISSIRPNPSSGTFGIELALDAPALVEVAVLDLAGRRVAQLFRGDLPAGARHLQWDGKSDDGVASRGGVYFLRASVGGRATVRKLILLGNRPGLGGATPDTR